jgi:ABC-2 type transport system ATP-binding protein
LNDSVVIHVEGLTKVFEGPFRAVDNVSFDIQRKEIFGLLGPNGAGKTTTIKMLCTLLKPTSGTALVDDHEIIKNPDGVRRSIGVVFQDPALDDELTARENLDFHARMYSMKGGQRRERIAEVLKLVDLHDRADIIVKKYSSGMKRRLEIARGLMHYPKVLFLDEPTLGLDAQTRRSIWDYVARLNREQNVTVFLTTHYMDEADFLCGRVAIMDHGKLVVVDSPGNLKNSLGSDLVTLECSDPERFAERLRSEDWVENLKIHDSTMIVGTKRSAERIPEVVNIARDIGVRVVSIETRKPTLEDVFLYHTGSEMRDSEPNTADRMKTMHRQYARGMGRRS